MNADNWIAHLQHPLVLAGFGLFVFALVIRPLFSSGNKLSGAAIERILLRSMILLFLLAITAMFAGVMLSWKVTPTPEREDTVKPTPELHPSIGKPPEELQNKSNAELSSLAEKEEVPYKTVSSEQKNKITIWQYIDHGDGTITDTKTVLMWKRCSEGLSGVNCEEGEAKGYEYDDAVLRFKDIEYAGYADWRMPTIDELKTLVYCSNGVKDKDDGECNDGSEKPMINQQAFPNTEATWYWSGSPDAYGSGFAWYVYFFNGNSYIGARYNYYAVRLVRGGL
jgi:hypothetical protein